MGRCLEISMNSKSDWLKSEAEHYQHCYQRMESACVCTNGRYFEYLLSAFAQLNNSITLNQSARNLEKKMCKMCIILIK